MLKTEIINVLEEHMVSSFMSRVGKISVNVTPKSESIRRRYITLREGE